MDFDQFGLLKTLYRHYFILILLIVAKCRRKYALVSLYRVGPVTTVSNSENSLLLTSQQVVIRYTLRKSRAGHWMRTEFSNYGEWLLDSLTNRLEAPKEEWPILSLWKNPN
jgi:hypothetical protein